MIVPKEYEKTLVKFPQLVPALFKEPIGFFGHVVKYPKQAHIIKTWLEIRPKVCIISGYKRTGKTQVGAFLGASWLLGKCNREWYGMQSMGITKNYLFNRKVCGNRVGLIGGKSLDHVDSVLLREYRELLPPLRIREWFSRQKHSISVHSMYPYSVDRMVIRSYDQDLEAWKSGAYNFIQLDESPRLEIMNECLDRTRTTKGRIIITVSVDDGDLSWIPEACRSPMKFFGTDSFLHFTLGVEDVPDSIYPPEEKEMTYRKYDNTPMRDAVRKGSFIFLAGRWYPEFDPALHVIPGFKIPKHWLKWRFMDAGMAAPAGCLWMAMSPSGAIFIYREYYKTGTTIDERCGNIIEMSGNQRQKDGEMWMELEVGEKYMSTILDYHEFKTDAGTGDGVDYHYVKAGLIVQRSTTMNQEGRREVGRKWLQPQPDIKHFTKHVEPGARVYVFDTCVNFIWEIQKKCVKREATDRASVSERKVQNRDDHLLDCFEYGVCEMEHWIETAREAEKE